MLELQASASCNINSFSATVWHPGTHAASALQITQKDCIMQCHVLLLYCNGGRESGSLPYAYAPAACTRACLHDAPDAAEAPAPRLLAGSRVACSCRFACAAGLPVAVAA